jgi:hypothetical protein
MGIRPAPAGVADEIPGAAFGYVVENLPDHDASAFEGWFAVAISGSTTMNSPSSTRGAAAVRDLDRIE